MPAKRIRGRQGGGQWRRQTTSQTTEGDESTVVEDESTISETQLPPSSTQPSSAQPSSTQPSSAQPSSTQPSSAQPSSTQSSSTQSSSKPASTTDATTPPPTTAVAVGSRPTPTAAGVVGSRPLNGRQSAAIAVGVVGFVVLVAFVCLWNIRRRQKFKLWAPIRWNGGGIGLRRSSGDHSTAKQIELRAELESDWLGLPVDDATIMRRFKEIDDRIASHVLEFYMPDKDVDEGEELRSVSRAKRRSITSYVSSFEYLVSLEEARVFVLRALLSGIILEDFDEGAFFTDRYTDGNCKGGRLTSDGAGAASGTDYDEARNRTVLRLADVAFEQLRPFVAHSASSELRKRSMESVVQSVAQFAKIVEKQPARFDLVWQPKGFERPKKDQKKVPLHEEEMEAVVTIARDRKLDPKVRGVVFPGLEKTVDLESLLLAKIQVLMY